MRNSGSLRFSVEERIVKGSGETAFSILNSGNQVVIQYKNGKTVILSRTSFPAEYNDVKCARMQLPVKLIYSGTIHRCKGETMERIVIDLRELYVTISRYKIQRIS